MKKIILIASIIFLPAVIFNNLYSQEKNPPPPPKKTPPKVMMKKFHPPVINVEGKKAEEFYKRNPEVTSIMMRGNKTLVSLKGDKKEQYDMTNEAEKKTFNEKYGDSPFPPPPPKPKNF